MEKTTKGEGLKRYAWLVAMAMIVIAALFLFGTMFNYRVKDPDTGVSSTLAVNLIDLLNPSFMPIWPMILLLSFLLISLVFLVLAKVVPAKEEAFFAASLLTILFSLCLLISEQSIFSYLASDYGLIANFKEASIGYGTAVALMFLALAAGTTLLITHTHASIGVRDIAENGILIAMAFVLNFIRLPIQTAGGSINFQMVPLFIIALRRGPLQGFIAGGLVYGLLTCLTDGYGLYCYPFDYLIGFGSVAALGFFRNKILVPGQKGYTLKGELYLLVGAVLATALRYAGSTVSSLLFYGVTFVEALVYNAVYIPVSGAIAIAVLMILYGPLCRINNAFPAKKS